MSDPIAAAEAAGKARDIANRFETAVFLIAYGIAEVRQRDRIARSPRVS